MILVFNRAFSLEFFDTKHLVSNETKSTLQKKKKKRVECVVRGYFRHIFLFRKICLIECFKT